MPSHDIRDDKGAFDFKSPTERGSVFRNSGAFTRGSNLISHQVFMFLGGAKWPFYLFLASLALASLAVGHFWMNNFDLRMVLTKWIYDLALAAGANPASRYNLIITPGYVHRITFGAIDRDPYVVQAIANLEWTMMLAMVLALLATVVPTMLYIEKAIDRGQAIMKDHHRRGAVILEADVLKNAISANNAQLLEDKRRQIFPSLSLAQVFSMPPEMRNASHFPIPYSIAGVSFPLGLELGHVMAVGTGMTGKTTVLSDLITQARRNRHRAVIFDVTGVFTKRFFNPETDVLLNPYDERCARWSIFHDCSNEVEIKNAAFALIPDVNDGPDPFWPLAARSLFTEMCLKLIEEGKATNDNLIASLMTADLKDIHEKLKETIAQPLTSIEAAKMAESIRAVFNANADILLSLPDEGKDFSIREWILSDHNQGSFLFITTPYTDIKVTRSMISLWVDTCVYTVMLRPTADALKIWFMLDELGALHQLPSLEYALQTARNFGGAVALGVHDFAQLTQVYGENGAKKMINMVSNKLFLRVNDDETALKCSNLIGEREVRETEESYSISNSNARDTSTITARTETRPLVLKAEIMNLRNMHGYLKLSDGYPAARITLQYVPYVQNAEPFVRAVRNNRPRIQKLIADQRNGTDPQSPPLTDNAGGKPGKRPVSDRQPEPKLVDPAPVQQQLRLVGGTDIAHADAAPDGGDMVEDAVWVPAEFGAVVQTELPIDGPPFARDDSQATLDSARQQGDIEAPVRPGVSKTREGELDLEP